MFSLINNSNIAIVVLHEIYGINQNINMKCNELYEQGYDVFCPNLLGTDDYFTYDKEKEAYINFFQYVGVKKSSERVISILKKLKEKYRLVIIIGYSVGATVAWLCSSCNYSDGVICFYGSRIRDYLSIKVSCPTALYFAETEKSFDVRQLVGKLKVKKNIDEINIYSGEHGFADQFTDKYNMKVYKQSYKDMINFIERIESKTN